MNEKEYFETRDRDLKSGTGTQEIKAILKEIDDERSTKDLGEINVLELGCGSGMTMLRLKNEFGIKNIEGIDISEYAVKLCKQRGLNAKIGDAENLEYKDNQFDFVYAQYILEHTDAAKVLNEALRVGKKVIIVFSLNAIPQAKISEILRKVPGEHHRYVKDIVKFITKGVEYKNWIVVLYRKKKEKLKIGGDI